MSAQSRSIDRKEFARLFRKQAGKNGWLASECCFPERIEGDFFPNKCDLFKALSLVKPNDVKYVILGQDPYPCGMKDCRNAPIATGVAFGVRPEHITPRPQIPRSSAIYKVLAGIYGKSPKKIDRQARYKFSNLEKWAMDHRILLLNCALTVPRNGKPGTHLSEWRKFLREVLHKVRKNAEFIAWGKDAVDVYEELFPGRCKPIIAFDHPSTSGNFAKFWESDLGSALTYKEVQ